MKNLLLTLKLLLIKLPEKEMPPKLLMKNGAQNLKMP
jgi:hypothetical protein